MTDEFLLGTSSLSRGGRTIIPSEVLELLDLRYTPKRREKLLWTQKGDGVVVTKGTPQSSYKKTVLGRRGSAAVPRHIRKALEFGPNLYGEERMIWIRRGDEVIVRKGTSLKTH